MNFKRIKHIIIVTLLASLFSGCGSIPALDAVVKDNSQKYQKAETLPPLAIPPDLSNSRINDEFAEKNDDTSYSDYAELANNPLEAKYNVVPSTKPALRGEASERHLVLHGQSAILWQRMLGFWAESGIKVKRHDQTLGLMDTVEDAEGYAYRVRVESGDLPSTLKMHISSASFDSNELKNEAQLRNLAEYMGAQHRSDQSTQQQATQRKPVSSISAVIIDEASDHQALMVALDLDTVWRNISRVVDSKYFIIQDRQRERGIYFVQYLDPFLVAKYSDESIFSKLAFWQDAMDKAPDMFFYIKLVTDLNETKVIILDIDQVRTSSSTARRMLRLIQDRLDR